MLFLSLISHCLDSVVTLTSVMVLDGFPSSWVPPSPGMPSSEPFPFQKGCSELGPPVTEKRLFVQPAKGSSVCSRAWWKDLPSESVLLEHTKKALASELAIYISSSETPQLHY